ncbi:hypothetical protein NEOLEDRAFT_1137130 [Neolentinus lepideus HHB14362 ss-1]|uniref:Uncharacterized protein n=1 Tax=Neolentinus lepideus HHB14362 ss-1 TaxID=1314782 RepID=A0A165QXU4_9AGAM|nr:hypothetical protein NEOLEDRAFT_1137130 [Neolentinus lepideus HHB14362 ss-1]
MPQRKNEEDDDDQYGERSDSEDSERGSDEEREEETDEEYCDEDWAKNVRDDGRGQVTSQHQQNERGVGAPLKRPDYAGGDKRKLDKKDNKNNKSGSSSDKTKESGGSSKNPGQQPPTKWVRT